MEPISLPNKFEIKKIDPQTISVVLEPCYPGYGVTLGNALRRVILSSIPGAAVTAIKIKGVDHEFSTIPNVKEDVIQIILNLKQLKLKVFQEEPVRLHLYAKGEKIVTAKDIEPNSAVEIINKDLPIAHLTNKNAELDMEIFVAQGRGYLTSEEKPKKGLEIGTIVVDSIFTPIRNVSIKVEPARVGQMTNFDRLILNIETNGVVTPEEALKTAAQLLIDHFNFILSNLGQETVSKTETLTESEKAETESSLKKEKKKEKSKK